MSLNIKMEPFMSFAIPVRVLEDRGSVSLCQGRQGNVEIDMTLVGPQCVGTWVLNYLGVAQKVITEEEAEDAEIDIATFESLVLDAVDFDKV
jgi:hydrogenase expression/formation protein HypC